MEHFASFRLAGLDIELIAHASSGSLTWSAAEKSAPAGGRRHLLALDCAPAHGSRLFDLHVRFLVAMRDIHRTWVGAMEMWRGREQVSVALSGEWEFAANHFTPVICNYAHTGHNRLLLGLLNTIPNATITQRVPTTERGLPMRWLEIGLSRRWREGLPLDEGYHEIIYCSTDGGHWYDELRFYVSTHDAIFPTPDAPTPAAAFDPVWCSWYALLEQMTADAVRVELPCLQEDGFGTVLIDAPWFAHERHIQHCGHYVPDETHFGSLPALVESIHDAGLRAVLWCAPSLVGPLSPVRASLERFLIRLPDGTRSNHLCPGCPESVAHMVGTVTRLVRDYGVDGLKLDFLDGPRIECCDDLHAHSHPTPGEAMHSLFGALHHAITQVRSHALIEFRQRYANLTTRPFANCHRGNDAPFDADYIRRQNIVLRAWSRTTAVHSDYACWHPDESAGNVARMIAAMCLTGVPTVSVRLSRVSAEHRAVVHRWLAWYRAHCRALRSGRMRVLSPDAATSVSAVVSDDTAYVACFSDHPPPTLDLGPEIRNLWLFNGTAGDALRLPPGTWRVSVPGYAPVDVGDAQVCSGWVKVPRNNLLAAIRS